MTAFSNLFIRLVEAQEPIQNIRKMKPVKPDYAFHKPTPVRTSSYNPDETIKLPSTYLRRKKNPYQVLPTIQLRISPKTVDI